LRRRISVLPWPFRFIQNVSLLIPKFEKSDQILCEDRSLYDEIYPFTVCFLFDGLCKSYTQLKSFC
jgi:hypothetical protein